MSSDRNTRAAKHRHTPDWRRRLHTTVTLGATLGALGVVFGNIGTSPLYVLRPHNDGEGSVMALAALGRRSLFTWQLRNPHSYLSVSA